MKIKALLMAVLFSMPFGAANAAVIFESNLDDCGSGCQQGSTPPPGWTQWWGSTTYGVDATYDGVTHYYGEITAPGRGGTGKSLKVWRAADVNKGYAGNLVKTLATPQSHLFIRFYMKIPAAFNLSGSNYQKFFRWYTTGGVDKGIYFGTYYNSSSDWENTAYFETYIYPVSPTYYHIVHLPAAEFQALHDGNWHCWEYEVDIPNKNIRVWIDGTLADEQLNVTNLDLMGNMTTIAHIPLGNTGSTYQSSWQAVELDDVVVSTTYVGTGDPTPPETDTTAPVVTISTTSPQTITVDALNIQGTASDAVGVVGCKYQVGAPPSATTGYSIAGTTSYNFTASGFPVGASAVYVGCYDAEGNYGYDSVDVTYNPATTEEEFIESFEDLNFGSRGWYDMPDGNTFGVLETSGCVSGNCLRFDWAQSDTKPTNTSPGALRRHITATDSLYMSFFVKFEDIWQGSQQPYHPHIMHVMSNLDSDYQPLAASFLNGYVEFISDIGTPYAVRPAFAAQDLFRVNTSYGTPVGTNDAERTIDLTGTTENRSTFQCNQPHPIGVTGVCYASTAPYWYSAYLWKDTAHEVQKSDWHKIEVNIDMNTIVGGVGQKNGKIRMWVDGLLTIDRQDVQFLTGYDPTIVFDKYVMAPYIGDGSPIAQTMWIDELHIGRPAPLPYQQKGVNKTSMKGGFR